MDNISLLVFVVVGLIFWFFFKRAQWKKRREQEVALLARKRREEALPLDEEARRRVLAFREKGEWALWEQAKNNGGLQARYILKRDAARQKHSGKARPCPKCCATADKLEWFYFPVGWNQGWATACNQCNVQIDFFAEREEGHTELWERLKDDAKFQAAYASKVEAAKQKCGGKAHACPSCGLAADKLQWFYFATPAESWRALAGRAGWMTACQQCAIQVDFFVELMN